MGEHSGISWTNHTFNPWIGCAHAPAAPDGADGSAHTSPGCDNCYAESMDGRFGGGHWGDDMARKSMSSEYWRKPIHWNARAHKNGVRERVFCASLADWAEMRDGPIGAMQDSARVQLWHLIDNTPWLDWLLLSKRPQNWKFVLPWLTRPASFQVPNNVWLGVTGENTEQLLWRSQILRATPAAKRFVSAEPLLEHISAEAWSRALAGTFQCTNQACGWVRRVTPLSDCTLCVTCGSPAVTMPGIDWLIVGDESGPGKRAADPAWVRTARDAAERHGVAFHFKQWCGPLGGGIEGERRGNGVRSKIHLPIIDGRQWHDVPGVDHKP